MSTTGTAHHGVSGVEVAPSRYSSSPELSSPPRSLSDPDSPAAQLNYENRDAQSAAKLGVDAAQPNTRKKAGRKPAATKNKVNPEGSSATNTDAPKAKRTRKPRDPNAPAIVRKRRSAVDAKADVKVTLAASKQPKITEMAARPSEPNLVAPEPAQRGKTEDIQRPIQSFFNQAPPPPPQPPQPPAIQPARTSGQNYDPIRSNYDPVRETIVNHPYNNNAQVSPRPSSAHRASASPSIASLLDPPNQITSPSRANQSFFSHQMKQNNTPVPTSPTTSRLVPSPMMNTIIPSNQAAAISTADKQEETIRKSATPARPMIVEPPAVAKKPSPKIAKSSTSSSTAASPRPPVDITPPPLPGSAAAGPDDGTEVRAPTIILHIPMNGEFNKYVNFTRLAEEQYGWDALHPRLAAQRDRLARVAAAGAALEKSGSHKESGDEMSLDMSEGEGSNVEMGGMSDGRTGTDGGAKKAVAKRTRKTKEDEYDKDDGFVDDSEMLWEEQAAASKDGFFVYSGPLVPEGEKPMLDRGEPVSKRGRGAGRGRGRGGAAARAAATPRTSSGTSGGPGSRGGAVTRKPRITKADRESMHQEKMEREKMGSMTAKSSVYSVKSQLEQAANMGGTPMVFN